jgi:hypothetical protein
MNETSRPPGGPLNSRTRSLPLRPVEVGELHSLDRCAWCAAPASDSTLKATVWLWTDAPAFVCVDVSACARRNEIRGRAA